jgi:hypothetical protein
MAEEIKHISSFSIDAIHNAIGHAFASNGDEKKCFLDTLKSVQSLLQKPAVKPKKKSTMSHLSDKKVFEEKILLQIIEKITEYDRLETTHRDEWKVQFDFLKDYKSYNMEQLKLNHSLILREEQTLSNLNLVVKYYRGLVYCRALEIVGLDGDKKVMFRSDFGICYNTAMRYVSFAALIKRYPRLMICRLSYEQIAKHQKRLLDHLKSNTVLHDQLSQPLNVDVQSKNLDIEPADINVPRIIYSTDPDFVYEDFYDSVCADKSEDEEQASWLHETTNSGEMFKGQDTDVAEMMQSLDVNK